jgi:protein gp37
MADNSKIEWTDATWNIITGCAIESPGCKNCYAMKLAGTRLRNHPSRAGLTQDSAAGPVWTGEVRFNAEWLRQPLNWNRGRQIFPAAHGDLFHPAVPDAWLDMSFAVMALTKRHTYQCLTKRPGRAAQYLRALMTDGGRRRIEAAARTLGHTFEFAGALLLELPLFNVMIGASVENQRYADERLAAMCEIGTLGWRTWVSYEPALGPVDWAGWQFLTWMVSGGESGPGARPHHPDWHRDTRNYCAQNRIAYHFKQWGAWAPWGQLAANYENAMRQAPKHRFEDGTEVERFGKKATGRLLDGRTHDSFPEISQ